MAEAMHIAVTTNAGDTTRWGPAPEYVSFCVGGEQIPNEPKAPRFGKPSIFPITIRCEPMPLDAPTTLAIWCLRPLGLVRSDGNRELS